VAEAHVLPGGDPTADSPRRCGRSGYIDNKQELMQVMLNLTVKHNLEMNLANLETLVLSSGIERPDVRWDVDTCYDWAFAIVSEKVKMANNTNRPLKAPASIGMLKEEGGGEGVVDVGAGGHVKAKSLIAEVRPLPVRWASTQTYDSDEEEEGWPACDQKAEDLAWELMDDPAYQKVWYPHIVMDAYHVDEAIEKAFKVYDFDCSTYMDDMNEIMQLTTNLLMQFKIFLWTPDTPQKGRASVGNRGDHAGRRRNVFGYDMAAIEKAVQAIDERELKQGKFDIRVTQEWFKDTFLVGVPCPDTRKIRDKVNAETWQMIEGDEIDDEDGGLFYYWVLVFPNPDDPDYDEQREVKTIIRRKNFVLSNTVSIIFVNIFAVHVFSAIRSTLTFEILIILSHSRESSYPEYINGIHDTEEIIEHPHNISISSISSISSILSVIIIKHF